MGKKHFNIDLFKLESKQEQAILGSRLVGRISDLMENETVHLEASVDIPDSLTLGDSHPLARENSHSRSTPWPSILRFSKISQCRTCLFSCLTHSPLLILSYQDNSPFPTFCQLSPFPWLVPFIGLMITIYFSSNNLPSLPPQGTFLGSTGRQLT